MADFVPALLIVAGCALCAAGERAMLAERWHRALFTAAPGVAFVTMGVTAMVFGLAP